MTREEELDWLCRLRSEIYVYMPKEWLIPMNDALDMAIQALSQEPTEKPMTVDEMEREYEKSKALFHKIVECDDAISREWLMRKATERFYTTNYFNHISAMIEEAPSVTHKSGKWIERKNIARTSIATAIVFIWAYECSECGHEVRHKTRFCASCGARMESEV